MSRLRLDRLFLVCTVLTARVALAEPDHTIDVVVHERPPLRRRVTIAWNPVPVFTISKLSFDLVITPVDHHALVISPFYAWPSTNPIYVFDDMGRATQLPQQGFSGGGAELGYRYYFGRGGPRGAFLGGSLLLSGFQVTAGNGQDSSFFDYGVAADVGYSILLLDRLSIAVGAGVQYTRTDKSIPPQQFPARIWANDGVLPRVLVSIGTAF